MISHETKHKFIAASTGALVAELITIPICTVTTNYQTKINHAQSIRTYVSDIYRINGIKGFYNAGWAASCSQISSLAVKYTMYENIKRYRAVNGKISNSFFDNCINSVVSGWCASIFHHPFDVIKIHTQRKEIGNSEMPAVRQILKEKGIINTFKAGYTGTLTRNTLTAIIFPLYDKYKYVLKKHQVSHDNILAPILTSTTSTILLFPFMYIRNRQIAKKDWKHGWKLKPYYRGFWLGMSRNVPHFTIWSLVADGIKNKYFTE